MALHKPFPSLLECGGYVRSKEESVTPLLTFSTGLQLHFHLSQMWRVMLKAYVRTWQSFIRECCLWSGFQNHFSNLENLPASTDCSTWILSLMFWPWLYVLGSVFFLSRTQNVLARVACSYCGNCIWHSHDKQIRMSLRGQKGFSCKRNTKVKDCYRGTHIWAYLTL